MSLISFVKKLVIFDVFWGRRSKIYHGVKDGGAKAATIADPSVAIAHNGSTIFNVNNPLNDSHGGHFHSVAGGTITHRGLNCLIGDVVGAWVRIVSSDTVLSVSDNTHSNIFGVITAKSSDTVCDVTTYGIADVFSGLDPTKLRYFLSSSGGLTDTAPAGNVVIEVGKPLNPTTLFVDIKSPFRRA